MSANMKVVMSAILMSYLRPAEQSQANFTLLFLEVRLAAWIDVTLLVSQEISIISDVCARQY